MGILIDYGSLDFVKSESTLGDCSIIDTCVLWIDPSTVLLENHRITFNYNLYNKLYYKFYMFMSTFLGTLTFSVTCLYSFYLSIYYACYIEETLSLASAVRAGAVRVAGISRERYLQRLTWLKEATRFSILFRRDDRQKSSFVRISNTLENLKLDCSNGRIRPQPFCVILGGPPGCGKTGTAMKLAAAFMKERYGTFKAGDVVTLNETDEYQSEYRTNHRVVIFDDVGAERPTAEGTNNPWRKIIDFVNNVRKTALNPNVELKGNVYIEPELVIVTTNLPPGLGTSSWMSCPEAIFRRISLMLYISPYDKVVEIHMNRRKQIEVGTGGSLSTGLYPDYSKRNMEQWLRSLGNTHPNPSKIGEEPKFPLNFLPLEDQIPSYVRRFQDHMIQQEAYVERMNSLLEDESVSKTPFQCFIEDQIYPLLPQKLALPPKIEARLPWYQRLYRKFCIEYQGAICQASIFESHSRSTQERHDLKWDLLRQTFDQMNFDYFVHFMCLTDRYLPTDFGFISEEGLKLVHPLRLHRAATAEEINEAHFTDESFFTVVELEQYNMELQSQHHHDIFDILTRSYATRDTSVSSSEGFFPPIERATPIGEDEFELVHSETIDIDKIDVPELRKQLLPHLVKYNRARPLMRMSGDIPPHTSAYLTFQMLRMAFSQGAKSMNFDYIVDGLTPDGFFVMDGVHVFVESKTQMCPRDQVRDYLRACPRPNALGVGINYRGFTLYKKGEVSQSVATKVIQCCNSVFLFMRQDFLNKHIEFPIAPYMGFDPKLKPPRKMYAVIDETW